MSQRVISLPFGRLPLDASERQALLRDYLCDKDGVATQTDVGWDLVLAWPSDELRHVDPGLPLALEQWGKIGLQEMWAARRRDGRVLLTLYDSWTLHSWSEWLAARCQPEAVTILHVDDHRDLGAPRLFLQAQGLTDPFTDRVVDIRSPDSVASSIESGAVGMGSFMTPFLHAVPQAVVRHLCQPPKVLDTRDLGLACTDTADTLLDPEKRRPAVDLVEGCSAPRYRATSRIDDWLDGVSATAPILLHIDMDYFNNRFDGDSDWSTRSAIHNPPLFEILTEIDQLTRALSKPEIASRIEDIVIAFSPGFFPAEYWSVAGARLVSGLRAIQ